MSRQINYKLNSIPGSLYSNPKTSPQSPVETAEPFGREFRVERLVATTNPRSSALSPQPSDPKALDVAQICADLLRSGILVRFRAPGDSMYPSIRNGDVITVMPIETASITIGDIILYRHKSGVTAHRVIRIAKKAIHPYQNSAPKSQTSDLSPQSSGFTPQTSDLRPQSYFILRGDAALVFDDPVSADHILGKVTLVEREDRRIDPYSFRAKICFKARRMVARLRRFLFFQT